MSSTALSVYPHLPPTTNLLNSQQRSRLLRSTRKLGAVLGTTPYLLENDTSLTILPIGRSTSKVSKRQGSIFTHPQPSSLSLTSASTCSSQLPSPSSPSFNLSQSITPGAQGIESHARSPSDPTGAHKRRPRVRPPQLHLQLNPVPASPIDDRLASPLPSPGATPRTPTTPIPDVTEIRRKRMAKLARHLGEKIPVELVFTSECTPEPVTASPDRLPGRRPQSVHVMSDDTVRVRGSQPPSGNPRAKQDWVGEWNRTNIKDVQKELRNLKIQ